MGRTAIAITALAIVLAAANYGYGLVHESAHGIVVSLAGGEVTGIYVNPLGLDAYIEYYLAAGPGLVAVELAGLIATTLVAALLMVAGKEAVPAFFALRTAIYAVNYAPGTDMANLYATGGNAVIAISGILVVINATVLAFALKRRVAAPKSLFSSLWRGYPRHSSGE